MTGLLTYCLKFSVCIAVIGVFYQVVLRKLTFYNWNRYYLLAYSLLSFFIAYIDISPVLTHSDLNTAGFVNWIPVVHSDRLLSETTDRSAHFTTSNLIVIILIAGMAVMFLRLIFQLFSFSRLIKNAKLLPGQGMKVYQLNGSIIPFSFGNSVFINSNLHTEAELQEIIRHEFVHVKQRHSLDIVWAEIICLLNWYNPFAWLLRACIRQNLEFIADNRVLQSGIDRKEYQYLLLKVMGNNQFRIAPKFNFSSLKKRIAMMNKLKSARLNLVRFLFALPLVAVLLLAFRNIKIRYTPGRNDIGRTGVAPASDTIPKPVSVSPQHVQGGKTISVGTDKYIIRDGKVVVQLDSGKTEEYDLNNKAEKQKFEEKYGQTIETIPATAFSVTTTDCTTAVIAPIKVSTSVTANVNTTVNSTVANGVGVGTTVVSTTTPVIAGVPTGMTVVEPVAITNDAFALADENGDIIMGDEEVLFTITRTTTREQLDQLKTEMKNKGFELNFSDIKYNDHGKLVFVDGSLVSKDVTSKFAASSFSKIQVSVIRDGNRTYFRIHEQRAAKEVI